MANSKYEYVRNFETFTKILPDTYILVRIDGRGFTKFSESHEFQKPNDLNALKVMNSAANSILSEFSDVFLAFGQSDEFSFVLKKESNLYERRESKIVSTFASIFTASYNTNFKLITGKNLQQMAIFDARVVCYPNTKTLMDYFSWRQVDCHINNLYNTCFWALVQNGKKTRKEAETILKGTLSDFKNEMLFVQFGINYNTLEPVFKKGTLLVRVFQTHVEKMLKMKEKLENDPLAKISLPKQKSKVIELNEDLIQVTFWKKYIPWILKNEVYEI